MLQVEVKSCIIANKTQCDGKVTALVCLLRVNSSHKRRVHLHMSHFPRERVN